MESDVHVYEGPDSITAYRDHLDRMYGDVFEVTYEETGAEPYVYRTVEMTFERDGRDDLDLAGLPEDLLRVEIEVTDYPDHESEEDDSDSGFSLADLVPDFLRPNLSDIPDAGENPYGVSGEVVTDDGTKDGKTDELTGPVFEETTLAAADEAVKSLLIRNRIRVKPRR